MDAHLIDADGNRLPPLEQRGMFPPIRQRRYWYAMNADLGLRRDEPPDDRDETIADLRAVLAPLLDHPVDPAEAIMCVFCHEWVGHDHKEPHKPDCPVLRRDEILGR